MGIETKEARHTIKGMVLENTSKAEWPEEISKELVFIKDSILDEGIPISLRVTLYRPMPNLWTEAHKEGGTRKESFNETISHSLWITVGISSLLRLLSSCLLLLVLTFFLLFLLMMLSYLIDSLNVRLTIQVLSRSVIQISSVEVNRGN